MKILNSLFAAVYSLILIATIWFGVDFLLARGLNSILDEIPELLLAVLFVAALIFSIFLHCKFRKSINTTAHKVFLGITSVSIIAFIWLILIAVACEGESCMAAFIPLFVVLGFWLMSLITGVAILKK